jgi:hypothetical protein
LSGHYALADLAPVASARLHVGKIVVFLRPSARPLVVSSSGVSPSAPNSFQLSTAAASGGGDTQGRSANHHKKSAGKDKSRRPEAGNRPKPLLDRQSVSLMHKLNAGPTMPK